jgi:hypothetical protein
MRPTSGGAAEAASDRLLFGVPEKNFLPDWALAIRRTGR